jgi:hypothetical protein
MQSFFGPHKNILIKIENITVIRSFIYIIGFLFLLNLINIFGIQLLGLDSGIVRHIFNFVDFNHENNLPSFYSSIAILFSSGLLLYITTYKKRKGENYIFWGFLCLVFFFLALDENCEIHEFIGGYIEDNYFAGGAPKYLSFKWVLPYSIFAIGFGILSIKFLFTLPRVTMVMFIISGSVYTFGAIGCEVLESVYLSAFGNEGIGYPLFYTLEETLEMVGIAMFIYSLMTYISFLKAGNEEKKGTRSIEDVLTDNVMK